MRSVLITGGSRGIGLEFAKYYAKEGYEIFLCARNMMKLIDAKKYLENTYQIHCHVIATDLSQPNSAKELYEKVEPYQIDVLINNAGTGYTERSWRIDIDKEEEMVMINDIALMSLTKLFLKDMKQRQTGMIINIASTGAFQPGPYIAGYYASKAFVLSYTEAINEEAKSFGVKVYCVCPGPVYTDFYSTSGLKPPKGAMHAEKCVQYVMKHLKRRCVIIPGFTNRLALLVPRRIRTLFVRKTKLNVLKKKSKHL